MKIFILFFTALGAVACASSQPPKKLEIIRSIPHSGYSEGLTWHKGYLWHALPKKIVRIDPKNGAVLQRFQPASEYSESLVWFRGSLWNVSFKTNGLYKGSLSKNKLSFVRKGTTPEKHAWGLTHDGTHLVMTGNYSNKIYFFSPATGKLVRQISTKAKDIEDLAWDGKGLWSSSFTEKRGQIFRINPVSGKLSGYFILPDPESCPIIDGIAYDGKGLWITGKHCPSIYYVRKPSEKEISASLQTKPTKKRSQ